jgi:hypothetical protein
MKYAHTYALHLFLLLVLFLGSLAAPARAQQTQTVTMTITVRTEAGAPLENVPLEMHSPTQARFGFTGADGVLTTPLEVTEGDDAIDVWLHPGFRYDPTLIDVDLAEQMYMLYREQYYFRSRYHTQILTGQDSYSISITAHPIVHVTGSVIPPGPQEQWFPDSVFFDIRDGLWIGTVDPVNEFSIPVRRSADTELFISMDDSPRQHIATLTAAQTVNDVNLGQITIPPLQTDASTQITMQNAQDQWAPGVIPLWRGVTLISDDGSVFLSYPARPDDGFVVGNPDSAVEPDLPPQLPAGVYYVAPGFTVNVDLSIHMRLLDAIRDGQLAQLDAAGVPKFTAIAGQTTQFTFDAAQARDAILAATGQGP